MRVALVTTRHAAQDDRIYYKQALSLARRYEVVIVAPDDGVKLEWPAGMRYWPIPRRRGVLGRLWSLVEALWVVRGASVDVCHIHDLELTLALPLLRAVTGARLIYDAHEAYPEAMLISPHLPRWSRPLAAAVVDWAEKLLARTCEITITADEATARSFERKGIRAAAIFNYPRLADLEASGVAVAAARTMYGRGPVLLYQGSMGPERGLFHMVRGLQLVRDQVPDVKLVLIGLSDGDLRRELDRLARALDVTDAIQVVEWVPHVQVAAYVRAATIGLVPLQPVAKFMKNVPIKLFEFMACGLPIVAAALPPIEPYLEKSGAGVVYDSTRPEELARAVLELLASPARCREMAAKGRLFVGERWNWTVMERRLFSVYESVAAPRRGEGAGASSGTRDAESTLGNDGMPGSVSG